MFFVRRDGDDAVERRRRMPHRQHMANGASRWLSLLCLVLGIVSFSVVARAEPVLAPRLSVKHVLGNRAAWMSGWNEAIVFLDNAERPAFEGMLRVVESGRTLSRVPLKVAAGERTRVLLPFSLPAGQTPHVSLVTKNEHEIADIALSYPVEREEVALLVEIQGREARGDKLLGASEPPGGRTHWMLDGMRQRTPEPRVSTASFASETSDPILPDVTVGWNGAAMAVISSDHLARLSGRPKDALIDWVRGGGLLAVALTREGDLASETLQELARGEVHIISPVGASIYQFTGPNVHAGDLARGFGSSEDGDYATLGLGELWLLRRDPWARNADPRSQSSLADLWMRAVALRSMAVTPPSGPGLQTWLGRDTQSFLDPGMAYRAPTGWAALALVIYGLIVGPGLFALSRRAARPLQVLWTVPVAALVMLVVMVGLGSVGRKPRARRLMLVDIGSDQRRGVTSTIQTFYLRSARVLDIKPSRPVDAVWSESFGPLEIAADGLHLRDLPFGAWKSVETREAGGLQLAGVLVLEGSGSHLTLTNHTPYVLREVILHPGGRPAPRSRWFAELRPEASVEARDGLTVERAFAPGVPMMAGRDSTAMAAASAMDALTNREIGQRLPTVRSFATAVVTLAPEMHGTILLEQHTIVLRVLATDAASFEGPAEASAADPSGRGGQESEL